MLISLLITPHLLLQPQTPLRQPVQVSLPKKRRVSRTHRSQELNLLLSLSPFCHPSPRVIRSSSSGEKEKILLFSLFRFFFLISFAMSFPLSPSLSSCCAPLSHPLSLSACLALSASVCGCAGGQHESCGSHGVVRESDGRRDSPRLLSPLALHPPTADEGGREAEEVGGVSTLLHIYTTPIPSCRHVCRSGPLLHTGCPPSSTHTHTHPTPPSTCLRL